MLKDYLLSLGFFLDNEYLDEYLQLMEKPFVLSEYTELHHIIPVSCYTDDYSVDRYLAATKALEDKHNKLVKLSFQDHFYAHWLLFNCTVDGLKTASARAVLAMSGLHQEVLYFTKDEILKIKDTIKKDLDIYWSAADDEYLINSYHAKLTSAEVQNIANSLNKTEGAVRTRIVRLKLSTKFWTDETIEWLKSNYNILGKKACAEHLGRSELAIEHKVNKLGISTRQWTDEQIAWLTKNYGLISPKDCAEYLGKSTISIRNKAALLRLASVVRWTETADTWLIDNKPSNTWDYCAKYLGRSIKSVKQRYWLLTKK